MNGRIVRVEKSYKVPVIGKIKCGEKAKNAQGTEYPRSLDYFRATGDYAPMFHKVFGAQPKKIEVIFLSNNIEDICNERYELRDSAGKLYGYGDGATFFVYDKEKDKLVERIPNDPQEFMQKCEQQLGKKWQITLTINFLIPAIKGVFGTWQFVTKAEKSTIPTIVGTIDKVRDMAGTIVNIPFDLIVDKVTSQKPGSKSSYPVVKLIANVSSENLEKIQELMQNNPSALAGKLTEEKIENALGYPKQAEQILMPKSEVKGTFFTEEEIEKGVQK